MHERFAFLSKAGAKCQIPCEQIQENYVRRNLQFTFSKRRIGMGAGNNDFA